MADHSFTCPSCGTAVQTTVAPARDQVVRCTKCGEIFVPFPRKSGGEESSWLPAVLLVALGILILGGVATGLLFFLWVDDAPMAPEIEPPAMHMEAPATARSP